MMNLFSSFNPITMPNITLNWMMLMAPLTLMMSSYWVSSSPLLMTNNLITENISIQLKASLKKINTPNLNMIMTPFMLILMFNVLSMIPNTFPVTSHIMVNTVMALTLWTALLMKKMKKPMNLMCSLTPSGTPIILVPLMVMIELASLMIQPITLSVRLTANITAGHIMMIMISNLYNIYFTPTILMNLMMMMLELMVALVQAYVFSMLITMYSK